MDNHERKRRRALLNKALSEPLQDVGGGIIDFPESIRRTYTSAGSIDAIGSVLRRVHRSAYDTSTVKLCVTLGSTETSLSKLDASLDKLADRDIVIITSDSEADKQVIEYAESRDIELWIFSPNWDNYGKSAAHRMRESMLLNCHRLLTDGAGFTSSLQARAKWADIKQLAL